MALAGWVGDKFNTLFRNSDEFPVFESVNVSIELLPQRRHAVIEQVSVDQREVRPGDTVTGKVVLQPYRGQSLTESFSVTVPPNAQKGLLRLLCERCCNAGPQPQVRGAKQPPPEPH